MAWAAELGDNPSTMESIRFCWKTQRFGFNGYNSSQKWMDDCQSSVMLFIAFLVLVGIVGILLGLRMCTMYAKRRDDERSEARSKKDE